MSAVVNRPDEPATVKQTYYIFQLGGGDVRDMKLTRQQASEMISELLAKRDEEKKVDFDELYRLAAQAANEAGDKWFASPRPRYRIVERADPQDKASPVVRDHGEVYGALGVAYLFLTDRRSKFAKWLKSKDIATESHVIPIPHKYTQRKEIELLKTCEEAALKVFNEHKVHGIKIFVSRMS